MTNIKIKKVKAEFNSEKKRIYCLCRSIDDGSLMLQCDYCKEWFHARCIGLLKNKKKDINVNDENDSKIDKDDESLILDKDEESVALDQKISDEQDTTKNIMKESQNKDTSNSDDIDTNENDDDEYIDQDEDIDLPDSYACDSCSRIINDFNTTNHTTHNDMTEARNDKSKDYHQVKRKINQVSSKSMTASGSGKKMKILDKDASTSKIRSMAKKGFLETFSIMFAEIENITNSISLSDPLQQHLVLDSLIDLKNPEAFATALEEKLYTLFATDTEKYKSKFRSLQFNLKDPSNMRLKKRILFSGPQHVSLQDLVNLTPEEMANDYVFKESEKVARESLKSVFKPKGDMVDSVEQSSSSVATSNEIPQSAISTLPDHTLRESSSTTSSMSEQISTSLIPKNEIVSPSDQLLSASLSHAKRRPSQVSAILPHTISSEKQKQHAKQVPEKETPIFTKTKQPVPVPQAPKQVDSLEDLLAKMGASSQNYSALHSASILENSTDQSYSANIMDSGSGSADFEGDDGLPPDGEVIWKGSVKMPIEGQFSGRAIQVYGSLVPKSLWPSLCRSSSELLITGRISSIASTKYIYERLSKKSDIIVVEMLPDSNNSAASTGFQKLVSYFSTKDRWAVIDKPKGNSLVKDFYLVPVPAGHQLLTFFSDLEGPVVPIATETKRDRFFGILVLATGALSTSSTSINASSSSQKSLFSTATGSYTVDPRLESVNTLNAMNSTTYQQPPVSLLPSTVPPSTLPTLPNFMHNPSISSFQGTTGPSFPFLNQFNLPATSSASSPMVNVHQGMIPPTQFSQLIGAFGGGGNVGGIGGIGGGGMQVSSTALNDLLKNLNQAKQ